MDVKPPNAQIPINVPATYQRTAQILQRAYLQTKPVSPDDIIDCVEIQTGKPSPANTHIIKYKPLNTPLMKDKGSFIDIWI
ncbi:MAG TPA: hypothetical protein VEF33_08165 [Syntrophales bacterium]|nr:hypothetical protein [Syntrophales bacterium]